MSSVLGRCACRSEVSPHHRPRCDPREGPPSSSKARTCGRMPVTRTITHSSPHRKVWFVTLTSVRTRCIWFLTTLLILSNSSSIHSQSASSPARTSSYRGGSSDGACGLDGFVAAAWGGGGGGCDDDGQKLGTRWERVSGLCTEE